MSQQDDDKTRAHVTLSNGMMVSHYRIVEKIGAGGMGEVYRAEDTSLGRQVAIKVPPDLFVGNAERLARFEREAKLLAVLNHPNLATVYGFENVEGKRFLVMEMVEGETLAERIAKGPLPLDDALDVFRQIAAGMEAAHEKGIIHRDLKPANIKITPDGKVKILDFGLAKALHGETAASDLADSPTITENMTRAGVILGTAAYMSPEQAKGRPVDKRTDIWAFGCIVYECLTGRRAFEGETASETLAAILRGEPDWNRLPIETPPHVRYLLNRCLQKDPGHRLRDIGDAVFDANDSHETMEIEPKLGQWWRKAIPWIITALAVASAIYILITDTALESGNQNPIYSSIQPPENSVGCFRDGVALSPDGSKLAFSSISSKGERLIWIRALDRPEAISLPGTDGGTYPFWSPDNKSVAFYADGWLKRVSADGGPVQTLCRATSFSAPGGSWGSAGTILFCDVGGRMSKISETGGAPVTLSYSSDNGFPCYLPDGKHFLYSTMLVAPLKFSIWISSVDDSGFGREIQGTTGIYRAEFLPPHSLLLYQLEERSLSIQRVDLSAATLDGQRILLADQVPYPADWPVFAVSQSGSVVFLANPREARNDFPSRLNWLDREGKLVGSLGETAGYWYARISPDGRHVACSQEEDVRVFELPSGLSRRITNEMAAGSRANWPTWSPAGDRFLASAPRIIKEYSLSGDVPKVVVGDSLVSLTQTDWSHDGRYVLCDRFESADDVWDIAYLDLVTKELRPFLTTRSNERAGHFSPDGRWVAYVSDETGSDEVYVRSFPDGKHVKRISYAGGTHPRWRGDGEEMFFLAPGWVVMSATVRSQPDLKIGTPVVLFQTTMADLSQGTIPPYDVTPDGQRFLVIQPQSKPLPLTLVQNWQALVDR